MKLVLITGSPEEDKDSIVDLALDRLGSFKTKFKYLDLDSLGVKSGTELKDLKSYPSRLYKKLEGKLVSHLRKGRTHVIMNGSLTRATKYGTFPALPQQFFRVFKPDALVILESSPGDLVRDPRASHETMRQQELDRSYGITHASISDSPVKLITIEKDNVARAVNELLKYLRFLFKD